MAAAGDPVTITRDGDPVATLRALGPGPLSADQLLARWRRLPAVDADAFRRDIDAVIDTSL
jgi:antitoxin (DNA-binding transcriptional repressor) of toxin-antitoxin stability system